MKLKSFVVLFGICALSASASVYGQVRTDYDHSADFSTYKTYSWLKVQAGDSLWDGRLKQDIDAELASKGWTRVDSGGNAMVSAFRSMTKEQTLNTFYDGFGGGWRWRGFGGSGISTTTTQVTKVGNVVVDVFDARTQGLLWRGTDSDDLSSNANKNIEKLQKDVKNMFKHFPPK